MSPPPPSSQSTLQNSCALVRISGPALDAIRAHLKEAYPREGCGVLIGRLSHDGCADILRAIGTRNVEKERGADRYAIDPRDLLAIERELDASRSDARIIGFFHSHPDAPARPSQIDIEMARGLFEVARFFHVYAIAEVSRSGAGEMTFSRLSDELDRFVALPWRLQSL